MKEYYGTKKIQAEPAFGEDVNGNEGPEGYAIVYPDGYRSWSPKDAFEAVYRESGRMNFGHALEALKEGRKVARSGWNGKGMYVFYTGPHGYVQVAGQPHFPQRAFLSLVTAQEDIQIGWVASQSDMLEDDWEIVDEQLR